ncbi:MAG: tRNA1(Val) (adenine(37)-N6)-methyltransferase [Nitrospirae bacterium]|nr:tRNA1(Val) (adenine(37)-N6)-methyltransferase [Nitrospirota bacterium]
MINEQISDKTDTLDSIRDIKIIQKKRGYRFSVDALLLFSFVSISRCIEVADFGAGSGIISILLAKRYPEAKVYAIELQEGLSELAMRNVGLNGLENRVEVVMEDIKKLKEVFKEKCFDLIVSNPPFRRARTGLLSPEEEKAIARHEIKVTIDDILKISGLLLKDKGRFDLIYHPARLIELFIKMKNHHLEPKRLRFIHSREGVEAKMALIEGVKRGREGLKVEKPLYIYDRNGNYTEEMNEIYGLNKKNKK